MMARYLKFTIGSATIGYKTIEIFIKGSSASYKILRSGLLDVDKKISPVVKISTEQLNELDALEIFSWEKNYSSEAPAETRWELLFNDGKKIYRGQGAGAYPKNWEQLLDWLNDLAPELEFINSNRLEKFTLNYSEESLTLDRRDKTLTIDKKNSSHIYDAGDDIKKFFDSCQSILDEIELADSNFSSQAKIEIVRHDGSAETFETLYNENFLPGLMNFIEEIQTCADDLTAKIFCPLPTEIEPPRSKYILCKVRFKESYKPYTYRTDDETLAVGDVVDVPAGRSNEVAQARIVEIGYFNDYELPYPLSRIKKIIGKHIAADFENY